MPKFKTILLSLVFFGLASAVQAATVTKAEYFDDNNNGSIDTIRITLSENISTCAFSADDWKFVVVGDFNPQIISMGCLGNVITLNVLSDGNKTGSANSPSLSYKNNGRIMLGSGLLSDQANISVVDRAQPRIISTSPVNGSTVLSLNADVIINFSESLDANSVVIYDSKINVGNYVPLWNEAKTKVTLSHTLAWPENTTVNFGVLAAKDLSGNDLDGSVVPNPWNFQIPRTSGSLARPLGVIVINAGDDTAVIRQVTIDVAYLNATEIILSEVPGFNGASYQPIASHIPFTLSAGSGVKTVFAIIKGNAGQTDVLSDTIDYQPPVAEVVPEELVPVSDLGIPYNSLIKGVGPSVYYYAKNGFRYVFPDEKTLNSWYSGTIAIKIVTDLTLSKITFGGVVTYRPGSLIKINTDPKVYAVGPKGELHWIETEALARTLYGANWAAQVSDLPDVYFPSYKIGTSIKSPNDFNPDAVKNAYQTISQDLGV